MKAMFMGTRRYQDAVYEWMSWKIKPKRNKRNIQAWDIHQDHNRTLLRKMCIKVAHWHNRDLIYITDCIVQSHRKDWIGPRGGPAYALFVYRKWRTSHMIDECHFLQWSPRWSADAGTTANDTTGSASWWGSCSGTLVPLRRSSLSSKRIKCMHFERCIYSCFTTAAALVNAQFVCFRSNIL